MRAITFTSITAEEWRIYDGTEYVGDLYRHADILYPHAHYWIVHLHEDYRGPQRVHDHRIAETTERLIATHPFYG